MGGVIDVVYQTIINKWVTAPTDTTLKWWWQKETLLSIPSSVPISPVLEEKLGKVPKEVISQEEVKKIPEIVRDLILRRVNGILLRTNLLPKGNKIYTHPRKIWHNFSGCSRYTKAKKTFLLRKLNVKHIEKWTNIQMTL